MQIYYSLCYMVYSECNIFADLTLILEKNLLPDFSGRSGPGLEVCDCELGPGRKDFKTGPDLDDKILARTQPSFYASKYFDRNSWVHWP